LISISGCESSLLDPHDVGHAYVTTGRRGISMPTFLTPAGSGPSRYSHRSLAPSVQSTSSI